MKTERQWHEGDVWLSTFNQRVTVLEYDLGNQNKGLRLHYLETVAHKENTIVFEVTTEIPETWRLLKSNHEESVLEQYEVLPP